MKNSMALRKLCLQALNQWKTSTPCAHSTGNPLNLFAFRSVSSACENVLIQCKNNSRTRCLHTGIGNACEVISEEDNASSKTSETDVDNMQNHADLESQAVSTMEISKPNAKSNSIEFSAFSNLKASKRHDLAMVYTCRVCETRSVKTMNRESYEKGIVIVRCSGCNNLHLIADRLGWFGEPSSVEDFLRDKGEEIQRGSQDSYELTLEDLAGWKPK